ncbi:YjbQ family protein [Atopobacter sp. AH10]|uniref:YjbQ family protein n=1 Tax=Atopobacter sp. AH10 TaxID=2315861 RepID=UPI000EF285F5|nr:YjbQ family protein [Atopobacter sp. AH10]RLK63318.1 YjbQ family protein [Atopobacter sp. AH10]
MELYKSYGRVVTAKGKVSYHDITEEVREIVDKSGIKEGLITILTSHTTCSIFLEEFAHDQNEDGDDFLQADLNRVLDRLIPMHSRSYQYQYPGPKHLAAVRSWPNHQAYLPHDEISDLFNGDGHLRATLLGSSVNLDLKDGKLGLGKTGYVYFVDFDQTRERERHYCVIIIGEK